MEISNSVGQAAQFGSIQSTNNKPNSVAKESVRPVVPKTEPEQSSNTPVQPSIVIDEQAVALYKESQQSPVNSSPSSSNAFSSASQDKPSAQNETAVASYQAVGDLAKRESVQQLFGVDLFA